VVAAVLGETIFEALMGPYSILNTLLRSARGGRGRGRGGKSGGKRPPKTAEDLDAEMAVSKLFSLCLAVFDGCNTGLHQGRNDCHCCLKAQDNR
jgi:C-terminal duplication domain of Friend of PRMT1